MNDKWSLVTGAPTGFSEHIALELLENYYNIVLHGRNSQTISALANKLRKSHPNKKIEWVCCDAVTHTAAMRVIEYLDDRNILPEVIIHHVGGTLGFKSSLISAADWIQVISLNCLFGFELNRHLVPKMLTQQTGRIIHVGSVSAYSLRGSGPYACAKALLHSYTKTLGRELATTPLGVSCVSLGSFETEKSNWARYRVEAPHIISDFLSHHQAIGRLGRPEEIRVVIRMLIDPKFTFGQGAIVDYDGGTM